MAQNFSAGTQVLNYFLDGSRHVYKIDDIAYRHGTPVCYGTDGRWANHIYPIFLTESFVKSRFISAETFLHLF